MDWEKVCVCVCVCMCVRERERERGSGGIYRQIWKKMRSIGLYEKKKEINRDKQTEIDR